MKPLILAGGRGKRIGGSKAIKPLYDKPLIYWVFQKLKNLFSPIYISIKTDTQKNEIKKVLIKESASMDEIVFIKDLYPEIEGPLSGILSAMNFFLEKDVLLVVAVDQPLIEENFLHYLTMLSYIFCHKFLITTRDEEKIRPFPGIYPCFLKKELEKFLFTSPKKSLFKFFQYLLANQCILLIKNGDTINYENFININTLEDLERVEKCFSQKLKTHKM